MEAECETIYEKVLDFKQRIAEVLNNGLVKFKDGKFIREMSCKKLMDSF